MIAASRCPACDRVAVPPEERCRDCRAQPDETEVEPRGEVLTYTDQDGWIALVELEAGARVLARVDERPAIGDELELDPTALARR